MTSEHMKHVYLYGSIDDLHVMLAQMTDEEMELFLYLLRDWNINLKLCFADNNII